jgi:DNA-binding transcriptional regulator WhiA
MAEDTDKTAFIRSEREENSVKYIAKVFNQPPCQISKSQYNAIVKALREQDWRNNDEDEQSVISKIITRSLEPPE